MLAKNRIYISFLSTFFLYSCESDLSRFDLATLALIVATLLVTVVGIVFAAISLFIAFSIKKDAIRAAEEEVRKLWQDKKSFDPRGNARSSNQEVPDNLEKGDPEDE